MKFCLGDGIISWDHIKSIETWPAAVMQVIFFIIAQSRNPCCNKEFGIKGQQGVARFSGAMSPTFWFAFGVF